MRRMLNLFHGSAREKKGVMNYGRIRRERYLLYFYCASPILFQCAYWCLLTSELVGFCTKDRNLTYALMYKPSQHERYKHIDFTLPITIVYTVMSKLDLSDIHRKVRIAWTSFECAYVLIYLRNNLKSAMEKFSDLFLDNRQIIPLRFKRYQRNNCF